VRQPIETVPKDGNAIILEDHVSGSYELAHWSAHESAWVKESGGHCEIAPTYWHAVNSAKQLEDKENSEPALQMGSGFLASQDVPLQIAWSDDPWQEYPLRGSPPQAAKKSRPFSEGGSLVGQTFEVHHLP
jgi:hypothetical protein